MLSWCCMFVQVDVSWTVSRSMAASSIGLVFLGSLILPQKRSANDGSRPDASLPVLLHLASSHGWEWSIRCCFLSGSMEFEVPDGVLFTFCFFLTSNRLFIVFCNKYWQKSFNCCIEKCRQGWYQEKHPQKCNSHFQTSSTWQSLSETEFLTVNYLTKEEVALNNDAKLPSSHSITPPLHLSPLLHQPQIFPMRRLHSFGFLLPVGSMYGFICI